MSSSSAPTLVADRDPNPGDARREARYRRAVARTDHALRKSRRDGTYCIIDPYRNTLVAYAPHDQDGFGLTLDEIGEWVAES